MKGFFQNIGYKLQRFMQGRYGNDELSRALTIGALVLLVLSWILSRSSGIGSLIYLLSLAAFIWAVVRMYSKNIEKRRAERDKYLALKAKVTGWFKLMKRRWSERKTHAYFKCPGCGKQLRVPKGKGKLRITCPGCGQVIEKNT